VSLFLAVGAQDFPQHTLGHFLWIFSRVVSAEPMGGQVFPDMAKSPAIRIFTLNSLVKEVFMRKI
jgi:hypothetical protein